MTAITTQAEADRLIPELLKTSGERVVRITPSEAIDLTGGTFYVGALRRMWCDLCKGTGRVYGDCNGPNPCRCQYGSPVPLRISRVIVEGGTDPLHPDWVRKIRDDCEAAGVEFVFAGWGDWVPRVLSRGAGYRDFDTQVWVGDDGRTFTDEGAQLVSERVGREQSGRMLDGRTWETR